MTSSESPTFGTAAQVSPVLTGAGDGDVKPETSSDSTVSLHPLDPEDALRALLQTKPERDR